MSVPAVSAPAMMSEVPRQSTTPVHSATTMLTTGERSDFTLRAFIVVVVGGMGNLGGSILASIFISLLEAYAALIVSPAQAVIVSFIALILTLLFRPTGLFVPTPK